MQIKNTLSGALISYTFKNKYYNRLTLFLGQTLEPLVLVTYTCYHAYSSNLSTS